MMSAHLRILYVFIEFYTHDTKYRRDEECLFRDSMGERG
jgi:hypothetical protein